MIVSIKLIKPLWILKDIPIELDAINVLVDPALPPKHPPALRHHVGVQDIAP